MIERYERLPEWSRWILFLPLSATFSLIAILLIALLRDDFALIHSAVAIVSFAAAIYTLAPKWKNNLVVAFLILRMLFSVGMIAFIVYMGQSPNRQTWFEMGREVLGWVAGWSFYFFICRRR